MQTHPAANLIECFSPLADPRVDRTKDHDLTDVLVIAICSMICGGQSFNNMEDFARARLDWLKSFLKLRGGPPSHDTFNRVFAAIDPRQFLDCFLKWTEGVRQTLSREIVAVDGKALRRARNKKDNLRYVVSAWAEGNSLVLGQWKVADKSNEITAVPQLLRVLELSGCIVTIDAMGCQKKIAKEIIEADADYVLALKGNQETVHEEVKSFLDATIEESQKPLPPGAKPSKEVASLEYHETVEKDHGRLETRRFYQSNDLDWFADKDKWEGLRSVGMVESIREVDGQRSVERRYFLCSLLLGGKEFARAVRGHWGVENKLHWVMDVCFREDQSRARTGHAPENLATLRRLALNMLKRDKTKRRSIQGKQLNAALDPSYMLQVLGI